MKRTSGYGVKISVKSPHENITPAKKKQINFWVWQFKSVVVFMAASKNTNNTVFRWIACFFILPDSID